MRSFVTGGSGFVGKELISALRARGDEVVALSRSERSDSALKTLGATPVRGDLDATEALAQGMAGCGAVFHCAAKVDEWDSDAAFHQVNVVGTEHVLAAARAAKVKRFVLISTEAVLADGQPLVDADETLPLPSRPLPGYPASKQLCERRVLEANGAGLETVVVRPRLIWGRGDTSNLVRFIEAIHGGRYAWVGGGRYLTSTCHVANVCEGALLAAERGTPGEVYFLTDGAPVEFRAFMTRVFESQGVKAPSRSVPRWLAGAAASVSEAAWRALKLGGTPPATRVAVCLMGQRMTVSDAKARRELGYSGRVSVEEGLAELARLPPVTSGSPPVPRRPANP